MELKTILETLGIPVSTTIVLLLVSFIKIPKIELNIWGLVGKAVSKGLNSEVLNKMEDVEKKVDKVQSDLDSHIIASGTESALTSRTRILRFSDEVVLGQEHTKEHYEDILAVIDRYEEYCKENPDFPNNRCLIAIENIKDEYKQRMKDNSFVTIERLVRNKKE